MEKENNPGVSFGGGGVASIAGVFGGVAIAVCVPLVVLSFGQILGQAILTTLVMIAVIGGVFISFISAFFGMVMPSSVHEQNSPWNDPEKLKQWEEWKQQKKLTKNS